MSRFWANALVQDGVMDLMERVATNRSASYIRPLSSDYKSGFVTAKHSSRLQIEPRQQSVLSIVSLTS